jgi:hypothetical protein
VTDWAVAGVTAVLGGIGLYFAHSIRRRFRQEIQARVADRRFKAYAALWAETKVAAGIRELTGQGGLSLEERKQLADKLTTWYYERGNGMLLSADTRKIFLEAKHNLIRDIENLTPVSLKERVKGSLKPETEWGMASLRQISLLRNSMRADLAIYASPASPTGKQAGLDPGDREFLVACKIDLNRRPWRPSLRERLFRPDGQESRRPDA